VLEAVAGDAERGEPRMEEVGVAVAVVFEDRDHPLLWSCDAGDQNVGCGQFV
jgi:hypothetical protein